MNYYVAREGKQYGPYSAETAQRYLAEGSLLPTDYAREETAQTWTTLGQIFPTAPPAVTAPSAGAAAAPAYAYTPQVAQPQVPQQPAMQAPVMAQPAGAQYAVAMPIVPPSLHWGLVLVLGIFTGVFTIIWAFIQASFARKIDAHSKALTFYILWIVGTFVMIVLWIAGLAVQQMQGSDAGVALMGLGALIYLVSVVFFIIGAFDIRRSMLTYYNSVEPINLRLSGVMTFFFNTLYLQYHMTRIANWKQTGILTA